MANNYALEVSYGAKRIEDRVKVSQDGIILSTFTRGPSGLFTLDKSQTHLNVFRLQTDSRERERMLSVHEMHRRTGFVDLQRLETMLRHNCIEGISDLTVSKEDIRKYREKYHAQMCLACNLGKTPAAPAKQRDQLFIPDKPGFLHLDIMYITADGKHTYYLVGRDENTQMIFCYLMKDQGAEELKRALLSIIAKYKRFGHTITEAFFDNEKCFKASQTKLFLSNNGINSSPCPPGRHERRAEVAIKTIKNSFKTVIMGMAYPCPIKLYPWAIRWSVESLNLTLRSDNDLITPLHAFCGIRTNYARHLRVSFGAVVLTRAMADEAKRPPSNTTSQTFAIILAREDNFRGTYICVDLASKSTIRRKHFRLYPSTNINSTIAARINAIGKSIPNTNIGHIADENYNAAADDSVANSANIDSSDDNELENEILEQYSDVEENDSDNDSVVSIEEHEILNEVENIESAVNKSQAAAQPITRNKREWKPTSRYLESDIFKATINDDMSIHQALLKYDEKTVTDAVMKEIKNMYDRDVWEDANPQELRDKEIIPSILFLKAKTDSNGVTQS